MPENEFPKLVPHPFKRTLRDGPRDPDHGQAGGASARVDDLGPSGGYVELAVTSNYTFLTGASHPEEMVEQAARLGSHAAALTDTNTLAGIVRGHVAAKDAGIGLVVGSRVRLNADRPASDHLDVLVYPTSRRAYSSLCQLLTLGKRRAPKGECHLTLADLAEHATDAVAVLMPPRDLESLNDVAVTMLKDAFDGDRLSIAASYLYAGDDARRLASLARWAKGHGVPMVACNDVHYHVSERRTLQDVLTCIRHGCTIDEAGWRLHASAERHLKSPAEMVRLFAGHERAIARTVAIAERALGFSMDQLKYEYPAEPCPPQLTAHEYLVERTMAGAARRYPGGVPEKVRRSLEHELALIKELRYEPYFLTCDDIVTFARSRGILCQGRGGAANSAVCYCLGITEVDPARFSLLFERFVSRSRGEPPDIDIDFEHERREDVIQYLYEKYGRDRAALTAEVITYRGRSAVRDVGKAMGLSQDAIDALASELDRWHEPPSDQRVREAGFNAEDPTIARVLALSRELAGFPRHLSQHVGGFVITRSALSELVPIENAAMEDRTVIEWDKDDIDAMGMLKVDVLGLGMLTCIRKAFELVRSSSGLDLSIPRVLGEFGEDPAVYDMIQQADTVGVFQIESRAQMSMLPRLRPACFYDLVIEVAIVRPGPIQGKMVHPYLKRRTGEERVEYHQEELRDVLGRTLGVPLFQEQAMQLAIVAAGFTPDEADALRKAMAAWRRKGDKIARFGEKLVAGMTARGYPLEFAKRCFEQIRGFSEYGFPESHAASFALLVYVSCWLKRHHPAAFAAALINSQPMGFYAPAQIVRDAKEHGVEVREIDVNESRWDCTLEPSATSGCEEPTRHPRTDRAMWGSGGPIIRLGMRLAKGLSQVDAERLTSARDQQCRFADLRSLWRMSGMSLRGLRCLARADAMRSMGLDRRTALWTAGLLKDDPLPLFDCAEAATSEESIDIDGADLLPRLSPQRGVELDYSATGLSLAAHPISFIRDHLSARGVIPCGTLRDAAKCAHGADVAVAGLVLVRQRPGTASGVVFITLEDESGIANLVIWSTTFETYRRVARLSTALLAMGRVERQGEVVHVHVRRLHSLDEHLPGVDTASRDFH